MLQKRQSAIQSPPGYDCCRKEKAMRVAVPASRAAASRKARAKPRPPIPPSPPEPVGGGVVGVLVAGAAVALAVRVN
jgi:hypothetical protein